jgi:cob(I)alamin adenosyltransferase
MPIYTKTGDKGTTALFGGKRVLKCEELVDVYGSIDELNSWVGKISAQIESLDVQQFLNSIQSDLFTIGSHFAGWKTPLDHLPGQVKKMEARIDVLETNLPELRNFILPGGTLLSADIHVTRAVARRVERQTVALMQKQEVDPKILVYLNRLSDLLFMLARFINVEAHKKEVTWSGVDRMEKKR